MFNQFRPALVCLIVLTLITGVAYPLVITGIAQVAFPRRSQGSMMPQGGSELIGQPFDDPKYFWSRLSATSPMPYNASASAGSNLGPTNPALVDAVRARVKALKAADPENTNPIPIDLATASASGLDPHISPAAAEYQADRVARARHLNPATVRQLIAANTQGRQLAILGEPRVNVLNLNMSLDALR